MSQAAATLARLSKEEERHNFGALSSLHISAAAAALDDDDDDDNYSAGGDLYEPFSPRALAREV